MPRDTEDLIRRLAAAGAPALPLARPWTRVAIWCASSLPYMGLLYLVWPRHSVGLALEQGFVIEQVAALATGLTAAAAAFATVVPGYSRKLLLAPLVPLAVWVANVGRLCARDWSTSGHLPPILVHWACLPATMVAGIVPAVAILVMLRRGAPMTPRLTMALGALAVAGISNFGVRFVHPLDASFVVLGWHLVAVFAVSAAASTLGGRFFGWQKLIATSGVVAPNSQSAH